MSDKILKIKSIKPGAGRLIIDPYVGREEEAVKDAGGLFRPTPKGKDQPKGMVLDIDQNGYIQDGQARSAPCQIGDWVIIGINTQTVVVVNGKEVWETYQANVKAVIEIDMVEEQGERIVDLAKATALRTEVDRDPNKVLQDAAEQAK